MHIFSPIHDPLNVKEKGGIVTRRWIFKAAISVAVKMEKGPGANESLWVPETQIGKEMASLLESPE